MAQDCSEEERAKYSCFQVHLYKNLKSIGIVSPKILMLQSYGISTDHVENNFKGILAVYYLKVEVVQKIGYLGEKPKKDLFLERLMDL